MTRQQRADGQVEQPEGVVREEAQGIRTERVVLVQRQVGARRVERRAVVDATLCPVTSALPPLLADGLDGRLPLTCKQRLEQPSLAVGRHSVLGDLQRQRLLLQPLAIRHSGSDV